MGWEGPGQVIPRGPSFTPAHPVRPDAFPAGRPSARGLCSLTPPPQDPRAPLLGKLPRGPHLALLPVQGDWGKGREDSAAAGVSAATSLQVLLVVAARQGGTAWSELLLLALTPHPVPPPPRELSHNQIEELPSLHRCQKLEEM